MIKFWWTSGSHITDRDSDRRTDMTCLGGGMLVPMLLVLHVFTRDFSHCLRDALIFTCDTTASGVFAVILFLSVSLSVLRHNSLIY